MEWTEEDVERAKRDGWRWANGNIYPTDEGTGKYRRSALSIYVDLRYAAETDEWAWKVYSHMPWMPADLQLARQEGWGIDLYSCCKHTSSRSAANPSKRPKNVPSS